MIVVSGSRGLIGKVITDHLSPNVMGYDLPETKPAPVEYNTFIDCARYEHRCDQLATWKIVIEHFKQHGGGRMIMFSSIYGHKAPDFSIYTDTEIKETPLEYAMDKAAVEQATRFLAQKLKPWNIPVNCIAPGGVWNNHSDDFMRNYRESGKALMIESKNLLPVIDMLLHPDNAVNGQVITVDGGWAL
jgi:NAD(P)-dependent dehydrogenase (short-subunit alcohol dehydrogenase family)